MTDRRLTDRRSWRKSSYSGDEGGNCLEFATGAGTVRIRDSKRPDGPELTVDPAAWSACTSWSASAAPPPAAH
jgi:hypothetical protein